MGKAVIYMSCVVKGNATIKQRTRCMGNAKVYGNAVVSGDAQVSGLSRIYDSAQITGTARAYGDAVLCGRTIVSKGDVRSSVGTCDENAQDITPTPGNGHGGLLSNPISDGNTQSQE